ncbi:OLC1v1038700C1 [Oldenlandia corymbosa var. corymbosa]|uniref:OLC1v1038700C1 n=1 Tax=Oldenlandia corymbosa var. corymbosa TaxID=529605 RepID=A0AAV1D0E2_OLDCO|nr:OLC1v1038700C1 [Oldenlandia corymbosa var. corymbosa]
MGGNKQKKSSFSFFGFFKSSKPRRDYEMKDDFVKAYKVWPSDEDRGRWVAEPGIDRKASAFISSRTERWKSVEVAN